MGSPPLKVITAGDAKYRRYIELTQRRALALGYGIDIYDLNDLGFGTQHTVADPEFRRTGRYRSPPGTTKSVRALHKPAVIQRSLRSAGGWALYLDGDAILHRPVDDVTGDDFDVGVTVRQMWEVELIAAIRDDEYKRLARGYINAGVILFCDTPRAIDFVHRWTASTAQLGNDQLALNSLVAPWRGARHKPRLFSVREAAGVRVKFLPARDFNNIYLHDDAGIRYARRRARILHFRAGRSRDAFDTVCAACGIGEGADTDIVGGCGR